MVNVIANPESACFLDICIPTYNRGAQLQRLLTVLDDEIRASSIGVDIRITISDNHSIDNTQEVLRTHPLKDSLVVRRNAQNVGALRNIWSLCQTVNAKYVWIISDDDIPKRGSLQRILEALVRFEPAVLTFEFEQPPGSANRWHGNRNGIEEVETLGRGIRNLLYLGKLSKYVTGAVNLRAALTNMGRFRDTGYGWLAVILETVQLSLSKKIVIDHEFLVSCDDGYAELTDGLIPQFWDDYLLLLDHELVRAYCPDYAREYARGHDRYMVLIIYAVMAGNAKASTDRAFREAGKKVPFHLAYLRNPFVGVQWLSLRLGIPASRAICRASEYPARVKKAVLAALGGSSVIEQR
ncbi:MAG: glycosyltransferase [Candidatus Binatia bacterium]